ncbi:uncharacterized protein LOC143368625 isoform X2 [Andrena cerasifolii]|uniref:uncharacterized protein LOC143368625 isoform X2 n=1 Tax=Andrena cerasifolii TaxID=2819439 RepID=UPI0040379758
MNKESGINNSFAGPGNVDITSIDASVAGPTDTANINSDTSVAASLVPGDTSITSSDTKNDSSSAGSYSCTLAKNPTCAKRLNRNPLKQAFRKAWLKDPQFQLWLQETEDPHKAKCTVCFKFLKAGKSHLQQHGNTAMHIMNMQRKAGASIAAASNAAATSIDTSFAIPSNAAISSSEAESDSSVVSIAGPKSTAAAITRPDTENDSSSDSTFVAPAAMEPKAAKTLNSKSRKQAFRRAWLEDPHFKPWLEETEDPHKAKCKLCCKFIIAGKSHLQQHAITEIHIMKIRQKAGASISVPSNAAAINIDTNFAGPGNAAITSSDTKNDSSSASTFVVPAAKIVRMQTFRQASLEDPHFKPWLQQADDPHKAKCTVYSKYVKAGKSDLENHANSKAHDMNMVHQKEALTSTVKGTFADIVNVTEMTICIDAVEHDKRQCQVDEVPSTSSASEAASTRTRRNGETPATIRRIHPIVHDHRYAKIPRSMWKKILVQKKQIQAMKRERHVDKQHILRLKKQVTSLKRIVNELRRTRALPDSGPRDFFQKRLLIKNQKNIRQKQISKDSGNTI